MKKSKFALLDAALILLLIVPFCFIAFKWNAFPDRIATHFDSSGQPNGYMGKFWGLLSVPLISIAVTGLFYVLPYIDPRRKNYALFADKIKIIRLVVATILTAVFFQIAYYSLGYHFNASTLGEIILAFVFIVIGNFLGTIRSNWFIGVRTPWTLSNEEVWKRTHRMTGKLWVITGFIYLLSLLFFSLPFFTFFIVIAIDAIIPVLYSYIIYRKLEQKAE
jgi:uncharacterized membrane protein